MIQHRREGGGGIIGMTVLTFYCCVHSTHLTHAVVSRSSPRLFDGRWEQGTDGEERENKREMGSNEGETWPSAIGPGRLDREAGRKGSDIAIMRSIMVVVVVVVVGRKVYGYLDIQCPACVVVRCV